MGQSCGGVQTYAVAADPRIKLLGIWNSGIIIPDPNRNGPAMEDVRKDQLLKAAFYEVARNDAKVVNYFAIQVAGKHGAK